MPGFQTFVYRLISGQTPTATAAELDALLQWLAGRRNRAATMVEDAFRIKGIPSSEARRRVLHYLDASLFCHGNDYYRLLGVNPGAGFSEIRARHKQLLQVFHPDRHADERAWFTERSEQLNRAYAQLKKNRDEPLPGHVAPGRAPAHAAVRKPRVATGRTTSPRKSLIPNKNILRRALKGRLGTPEQFERRFYVVLFLVPVIALLIVYFNYAAAPERRNTAAPAKEQDSVRNTIVTDKGLEAGDGSEYEAKVHMGPDVVAAPKTTLVKESIGIETLGVMDEATNDRVEAICADVTTKSRVESENDGANEEENNSEDRTLDYAVVQQYGSAPSYQPVSAESNVSPVPSSIRPTSDNTLEHVQRYPTAVEFPSWQRVVIESPAIEKVRANGFNVSADCSIHCGLLISSGGTESDRLTINIATAGNDAKVQHVEHIVRGW